MRRTGQRIDPSEVAMIEMLDDLYLVKSSEQASEKDQQQAIRDGVKAAGKPGR